MAMCVEIITYSALRDSKPSQTRFPAKLAPCRLAPPLPRWRVGREGRGVVGRAGYLALVSRWADDADGRRLSWRSDFHAHLTFAKIRAAAQHDRAYKGSCEHRACLGGWTFVPLGVPLADRDCQSAPPANPTTASGLFGMKATSGNLWLIV